MPFKCFKCGKIGHFASKCSHKHKRQTSDDDEKYTFNKYNKEAKHKKKILCVNDVDCLEETDIDSLDEDEVNNFIVMAINDFGNEYIGRDLNEDKAMVDMEGQLINALEEIDRLRLKKREHKQLCCSIKRMEKNQVEILP